MTTLQTKTLNPKDIIKAIENNTTMTPKELFKGLSLTILFLLEQEPSHRPIPVEFSILWKFSRMFNNRIPPENFGLSKEIFKNPEAFIDYK